MERLLKNIAKLEYPREKLEIQVLDDSTDESVELQQANQRHSRKRYRYSTYQKTTEKVLKPVLKRRFKNCKRRIYCHF